VLITVEMNAAHAMANSRVRTGRVSRARRILRDDARPESAMKISNNIRNVFELPLLFHVLTIVL
jgi:hypothetical protein